MTFTFEDHRESRSYLHSDDGPSAALSRLLSLNHGPAHGSAGTLRGVGHRAVQQFGGRAAGSKDQRAARTRQHGSTAPDGDLAAQRYVLPGFRRQRNKAILAAITRLRGLTGQAAEAHAKPQIGSGSEYAVDFFSDAQHTILVGIRQNGPCGAFSYGITTAYAVGGYIPCSA
ncbi:hypothetical protein OG455_02375 [Kitasatospora sp. NBC_01287]|uniref:hypothetical protein n=1 Tax=Kitasatospora sp. NBC_01287 TaxID=2903573 RepID=UPI0022536401|nr:hypothetical protein [Kitasatospora sp. NBC_01287]MCX4744371.1 hypothetical protein [Kitasatospora sp. NBC_01287]